MAQRVVKKELELLLAEQENFDNGSYPWKIIPRSRYNMWLAIMRGPSDTPYEGGEFEIDIKFNKQYPHQPPKIEFNMSHTPIYHMNVSKKGKICLPVLVDEWSNDSKMIDVFEKIHELIAEPDTAGAIREDALIVYVENEELYWANVEKCTLQTIEYNKKKQLGSAGSMSELDSLPTMSSTHTDASDISDTNTTDATNAGTNAANNNNNNMYNNNNNSEQKQDDS